MQFIKSLNLLLLVGLLVIVKRSDAQGFAYIERQLLCALEQAPCDAWGRQIKAALPEIIGKNCQNCNTAQLNNINRVARLVQIRYPDLWGALVSKYSGSNQRNSQSAK